MPLYEYDCQKCGASLEILRKISEADDPTCPECGNPGLSRNTSRTAFQLKGSGWYADGYSGASNKPKEGTKATNKPQPKTENKQPKPNPTS